DRVGRSRLGDWLGLQAGTASCSSLDTMARLPVTPMVLSRASPPAKYSKVGTDWMPYRAARAGLVSTLTLATFTWPACSVAISSSKGAIILHGPHHSAQKSTRTGWLDWTTSLSKLVSLI